jgi:universal stress protein A
MIPLKTILVPVNFSEASNRALDYARHLAGSVGASLELLHVVGHPVGPLRGEPDRSADELEHDLQRDALARLDGLLTDTDRERGAVTACRFGAPVVEIVGYAAEHHIDLIVMGTHRHGPTLQMFTGSIAEDVLRLAPCPVLAVKTGADIGETEWDCPPAPPKTSAA